MMGRGTNLFEKIERDITAGVAFFSANVFPLCPTDWYFPLSDRAH